MPERTILVPLDATPFSRSILDALPRLFDPHGTRVVLLHVTNPPAVPNARPARPLVSHGWTRSLPETTHDVELDRHPSFAVSVLDGAREQRLEALRLDKERLERSGYAVECRVAFGDAAAEIADEAERGYDAIVMATHARRGARRALLGSVAQTVLGRLSLPVVMLRPPASSEA